jgi:hypothetical protein
MLAEIVTVKALSTGTGLVHWTLTQRVMSTLVVMFRKPDQTQLPYVLVLAVMIGGWPLETLVADALTRAGVEALEIDAAGKYWVLKVHSFLGSFVFCPAICR